MRLFLKNSLKRFFGYFVLLGEGKGEFAAPERGGGVRFFIANPRRGGGALSAPQSQRFGCECECEF